MLETCVMVQCSIDWSPISLASWDAQFRTIRRSTLLQHFPYAQAIRTTKQSGARHGIIRIDDTIAGLVQLMEVSVLRKFVHAISLDRGPLWFEGFGGFEHTAAFFSAFAKHFPKRVGRKIRLIPEVPDNNLNYKAITASGFLRNPKFEGYETIWIDLTRPEAMLRAGLNGKWRNILSKSERGKLTVSQDWTGTTADQFLQNYRADQLAKGYKGPSIKLVLELLKFMVPRQEVLILNATNGDQVVAAILVLLHGSSATYQVGWTTETGRKLGAHHQLLWRTMLTLKSKSITDFDLGGINDKGATGVTKFKQGLGGKATTLVGLFN